MWSRPVDRVGQPNAERGEQRNAPLWLDGTDTQGLGKPPGLGSLGAHSYVRALVLGVAMTALGAAAVLATWLDGLR